jgi:hypothetical protein
MASATRVSGGMPRFPSAQTGEIVPSLRSGDDRRLPAVDDRAERIRAVFGLRGGDELPKVSASTLWTYYEHLRSRLTIPFEADHCPQNEWPVRTVLVVGVRSPKRPGSDTSRGLYSMVRDRDVAVEVPLVDLEVLEDGPNFQLLEDYWYWVWNWGSGSAPATDCGNPTGTWS